uniref:Putative ionotropic receptor 7 n=1 Tax=Conopomorpha sinensis TaxID=940481 RepID=A0A3Q8HDQ2_9NEOP|nr:putative ionotropic receptor 7 [Conopomorpha sinensis]
MFPPLIFQTLDMLLKLIYTKYMNQSYCVVIVSENALQVNIKLNSFSYINPRFLSNDEFTERLLSLSDNGCSDYLVQMEQPELFMAAMKNVTHNGSVRRSDRKLVFLPTEQNNTINLLDLLNLDEALHFANILLVVPGNSVTNDKESVEMLECSSYDFVTHKFVGEDVDIRNKHFIGSWNSCSGFSDEMTNLFPHDMTDMKGRSLSVAAFTYEPYSIFDIDKNIEISGQDGIEVRIIDEFCRLLNCKALFVGDDGGEWGEIFENGTGNGVLGKVAEDRADVAITALYLWYDAFTVLDFSLTTVRTAITCITPSPRILVSWQMPLMPFTWTMWGLIIGVFLFAALALTVAQKWSTDRVFLHTFAMLVTQSLNDPGHAWRVRIVTGWLLLMGLVIDNAYSSGLAATFTVPSYEKSTDTIQDVIDVGMPWGATHDAWIFSLEQSEDPKIMQLVRQFKVLDDETLKEKSFTRSMGFSIEKLPAGYFAIGDYITKDAVLDMEIMLEDFYYEHCVVMARKSSPYTAKLNELIGRLHETGLMLAWETQVALKYLDYKVQLEVKLSRLRRDIEIGPLRLQHVVGIFFIYIIGTCLSLIMFVCELVSRKR